MEEDKTKYIFIFPDIHGRDFWKEPTQKYKSDLSIKFIFLGDYFDPYPMDGVTENDAMRNWDELYAELNGRENTEWLIGNHDYHYLAGMLRYYGCRRSVFFREDITNIINENFDKFKLAYEYKLSNGTRLIFSHAGITYTWAKHLQMLISHNNGDNKTWDEIDSDILKSYDTDLINSLKYDGHLDSMLWWIGIQRGGDDFAGSCIWADLYEHVDCEHYYKTLPEYKNIYQIFSHSYSTKPYITDKFAMLDCKEVFVIDCNNGKLMTYKEFDENIK